MNDQLENPASRAIGIALTIFSLIALATIASGYLMAMAHVPPATAPDGRPDEGVAAHIFQLSVGLAGLTGLTFLATADWTRPAQNVRRLVLPGAALFLAFAGLYLGEHYFWAR